MLDWVNLREQSIRPGGFGKERIKIWPEVLLRGGSGKVEENFTSEKHETHRDEHQILLDTDRSFVLYPVVDMKNKDDMKARLNELIVSVFRRRSRLNYYQGYHDIISVLFLTLPSEDQLVCAEQMSLQRLRDSMGVSLEPVLGLLRVLKKLIGLADPTYASLLNRNMPLPYHALSNILTLFSHDVPALPLIQHVFDFLLVRPPIAVVYLTAAIVLCRKDDVYRFEEVGEEGMLHSLLTSLPDIYEEGDGINAGIKTEEAETIDFEPVEFNAVGSSEKYPPHYTSEGLDREEGELVIKTEVSGIGIHSIYEKADMSPLVKKEADANLCDVNEESDAYEDTLVSDEIPLIDEKIITEQPNSILPSHTNTLSSPGSFVSPSSNDETLVAESVVEDVKVKPVIAGSDSFDEPHHRRCRVSLTFLLTQADDLYSRFPPSHPDLCMRLIMGPNSTVFTWSEGPPSISDDRAEAIVDQPETVVLPYVDPDDERPKKKEKRVTIRNRLGKNLFGRTRMGKGMLVGAVLVLGVAIAIYGIRTGSPNDIRRGQEVRRLGRWVGRLLLGS